MNSLPIYIFFDIIHNTQLCLFCVCSLTSPAQTYTFSELLGLGNILIENTKESKKVSKITLIKNVSIECNLVSSSYLNGRKTNILYRFTIPAPLRYDFEITSLISDDNMNTTTNE